MTRFEERKPAPEDAPEHTFAESCEVAGSDWRLRFTHMETKEKVALNLPLEEGLEVREALRAAGAHRPGKWQGRLYPLAGARDARTLRAQLRGAGYPITGMIHVLADPAAAPVSYDYETGDQTISQHPPAAGSATSPPVSSRLQELRELLEIRELEARLAAQERGSDRASGVTPGDNAVLAELREMRRASAGGVVELLKALNLATLLPVIAGLFKPREPSGIEAALKTMTDQAKGGAVKDQVETLKSLLDVAKDIGGESGDKSVFGEVADIMRGFGSMKQAMAEQKEPEQPTPAPQLVRPPPDEGVTYPDGLGLEETQAAPPPNDNGSPLAPPAAESPAAAIAESIGQRVGIFFDAVLENCRADVDPVAIARAIHSAGEFGLLPGAARRAIEDGKLEDLGRWISPEKIQAAIDELDADRLLWLQAFIGELVACGGDDLADERGSMMGEPDAS